METRVRIIPVEGPEREETLDWPEEPGYAVIKPYVEPLLDGAELERVNVWLTPGYEPGHNGYYTDMFVDEIGMLKSLPVNQRATKLYHANMATHDPEQLFAWSPKIHGPAVLFLRRVWF